MEFEKKTEVLRCYDCPLSQRILLHNKDTGKYEETLYLYCPRTLLVKPPLSTCDQGDWEN
jgi:hypothetical protein